jgi:hypothetical protein
MQSTDVNYRFSPTGLGIRVKEIPGTPHLIPASLWSRLLPTQRSAKHPFQFGNEIRIAQRSSRSLGSPDCRPALGIHIAGQKSLPVIDHGAQRRLLYQWIDMLSQVMAGAAPGIVPPRVNDADR